MSANGNVTLARVVGLPGAVLLGLGAILGSGIFVTFGIAAGVAGSAVLPAVFLAGVLATLNGLSSATLAARHPVSGGTYEYGYRELTPWLGFVAGWMFVCAKTASAATAALGFAGYALRLAGIEAPGGVLRALAVGIVIVVTVATASGMRRANRLNAAIVAIVVMPLLAFVAAALGSADAVPPPAPASPARPAALLEATALLFVAFTGYGRVATLGEEVRDPARTIPLAIVLTLGVALLLHLAVIAAAIEAVGSDALDAAARSSAAPLIVAARAIAPRLEGPIAVAALAATAGVLLNLVLGVSRVVLAMARRGDFPQALASVDPASSSPRRAVWATGGVIAALAAIGSIEATWSFSALTVLVYYAITNLAALRLPAAERRLPRLVPALGLTACAALTFWIDARIWLVGTALLVLGLPLHLAARRRAAPGKG